MKFIAPTAVVVALFSAATCVFSLPQATPDAVASISGLKEGLQNIDKQSAIVDASLRALSGSASSSQIDTIEAANFELIKFILTATQEAKTITAIESRADSSEVASLSNSIASHLERGTRALIDKENVITAAGAKDRAKIGIRALRAVGRPFTAKLIDIVLPEQKPLVEESASRIKAAIDKAAGAYGA